MELNDDRFWHALREALQQAEAEEAAELAAAERLLAETPAGADEPLSDERIDAIVRAATAPDAADDSAGGAASPNGHAPRLVADFEDEDFEDEDDDGRTVAADRTASAAAATWAALPAAAKHRSRFAGWPRPLAAAAAILLAPKFLFAATVVTAVVVTSTFVLRYTTKTLAFQDAVSIMTDTEHTEQNRCSAQGRVAMDLIESIAIVKTVAAENSGIAAPANAVLGRLRDLLAKGGAFQVQFLPDEHLSLGDQVADTSLDLAVRQLSLEKLAAQLEYGMLALKLIEQVGSPPALKRDNGILWGQVANELR